MRDDESALWTKIFVESLSGTAGIIPLPLDGQGKARAAADLADRACYVADAALEEYRKRNDRR